MGKRGKPADGPAVVEDAVITELDSAADLLETQMLEADFKLAVEYVANSATAGRKLSDVQQRRLYGLFHQATDGPATKRFEPSSRHGAREQWEAHAECGSMSKPAAMRAYCALLLEAIPEFMFADEDGDPAPEPAAKADVGTSDEGAAGAEGDSDTLCDAAARGDERRVRELLAADPTAVNARDAETKATALSLACDREHAGVVALLLAAPGVDINAADADGLTALHYACVVGSAKLARLLLDAGADPAWEDADGVNCAVMARESGADEVAAMLDAAAAV